VFEADRHYKRLAASAKVLLMDLPFAPEQLAELTAELCRRNGFRGDVYIRPCSTSEETFGVRLDDLEHDLSILASRTASTSTATKRQGLREHLAARRQRGAARAKITAATSTRRCQERGAAQRLRRSDHAHDDGHVRRARAANLFVARDGTFDAAVAHNLLEGISAGWSRRSSRAARPAGRRAHDRRTELYSATRS